MGTHLFIDETKAKSYVVVAVVCPDEALNPARRSVGRLVLRGQRTIHMKNESDRRRAQIAEAVCGLSDHGITAHVLDAGRGPESELLRRERALRAVVLLAAKQSPSSIVLDLDQTLVARDARTLSSAIGEVAEPSITYSHDVSRSQPLLALPDAIAWCWARNRNWRRQIAPIISNVRDV